MIHQPRPLLRRNRSAGLRASTLTVVQKESLKFRERLTNLSRAPKPNRMTFNSFFSANYFIARDRFCAAAELNGWRLESWPIEATGPDGQQLTIDVATSPTGDAANTIVVSSGLHGVEGFFGSAVQLALFDTIREEDLTNCRYVFLHALNPFGFAWRRRFNETNIDPNRNFLFDADRYNGAPKTYTQLDSFLNPQRPVSRWEPFRLKAAWLIAKHGLPALKQAIAAGQYEYPNGLFFGGKEASETAKILRQRMPEVLRGSQHVVHFDLHTGLGPFAHHKLLIDYELTSSQVDWLTSTFGPDAFETNAADGVAYDASGGFGQWCTSAGLAPDYLFACAEFGTYGPVQVLRGLRVENQLHHWGASSNQTAERIKRNLVELFCPRSRRWRERIVRDAVKLVRRASRGLASPQT